MQSILNRKCISKGKSDVIHILKRIVNSLLGRRDGVGLF